MSSARGGRCARASHHRSEPVGIEPKHSGPAADRRPGSPAPSPGNGPHRSARWRFWPRERSGRPHPRQLARGGERLARHQPAGADRAESRDTGPSPPPPKPGRVDEIPGRGFERREPGMQGGADRARSAPRASAKPLPSRHVGEQRNRRLAAVAGELAADEVVRLDAVGALVDRRDPGVAPDAAPRRSPRCSPCRHAPGCRSRRRRPPYRCTTP